MISIAQIVEKLVRQKPFLAGSISEGIINLSAYARKMKPEIEKQLKKEVTEAAILMALNRLSGHLEVSMQQKIAKALHGFGDIIVRSNLCDFTYANSDTFSENQSLLIRQLSVEKDLFYTISRGVYETTIVVNKQFIRAVREMFKQEQLVASTNDISSITIRLPKDNQRMPGLYYHVFKQIAWEGISILEVISTTNELSIMLRDKDVDRTFAIIKGIIRQ